MSRIGGEDSAMPKVEEEDRVMSGVGEEDQDSITKARYSNVKYSRNMTTEQLLESLKKLTGPGAEDERKRRVIVYTQREKNLKKEAKDQAWSKGRKARVEMTRIRKQVNIAARPARLAEKKAKKEAKKAVKKSKVAAWDARAREMGLQTPTEKRELKKIAKWERYKARKEAKDKSKGNMMEPMEEADVDMMKQSEEADLDVMQTGEEAEGATFQLPIREK